MTDVSLVLGPRLFQPVVSVASAVPGYGRHLSLELARPYPGTAVQTLGILIVASAVPAGYGCANTWNFDCCVCMFSICHLDLHDRTQVRLCKHLEF